MEKEQVTIATITVATAIASRVIREIAGEDLELTQTQDEELDKRVAERFIANLESKGV